MDVKVTSLLVNSCGMILNAYIHSPACLRLARLFKGKSIFKLWFFILIVLINSTPCELADLIGVLICF